MCTEPAQAAEHSAGLQGGARAGSIRDLGWLALAVVLAFATAVAGGFVWQDHSDIQRAGYRITGADDWHAIWSTTQQQYRSSKTGIPLERGGHWRPVYALSLSLDWLLWQDRSWCYHVENVLWHLLVVVGLYLLGRRLFDALSSGRQVVFWATLLFAVHPLGIHSVTWISGRPELLCAAFAVATLLALARVAADSKATGGSLCRIACWLLVSAACLVLAVGSKQLGMVVPLVATALFWPVLGVGEDPDRRRLRAVRLAGLGVLWLCAAGLAIYQVAVIHGWRGGASYPTDALVRNVATSANLWWHYVARVLTPYEVRLSDAWPVVGHIGLVEVLAMLGILVLGAVLVCGFYRRWAPAYGLLWYVIWMLPAAGLLPLWYFRAERSLYPASWGLLLAIVMIFLPPLWQGNSKAARRTAGIVLIGIVAWLILTTAYASTFWSDDSTLFERSLAQDPRHLEARMMLAGLAFGRGQYAESVQQSRRVISDLDDTGFVAHADPYLAHTNLGTALLQLQLHAEARRQFEAALAHRPDNHQAHHHVGLAALALGDLQAARKHFTCCLELAPTVAVYRHNLAATLLRLNQPESCVELLRDYAQQNDSDLITRLNFASALLALARFDEAEPYFETLVAKQPENPILRAQLAWCQWKTGKKEQAKGNLEQSREQAPNHPIVGQVSRLIEGEPSHAQQQQASEPD